MGIQVAQFVSMTAAPGLQSDGVDAPDRTSGTGQPSRAVSRRSAARRQALSDEDLARRSASGDEEAYETLVTRYARPLFNAAFRLLGDGDDDADAAQEALIQLYVALPRARLDLPLRPWLFRVCRNRCLDLLRRRRALPFSAFLSDDDSPSPVENVVDSEPLPEESLLAATCKRR